MRPVCNALDKLQGGDVGLGYLLPPLYVMTTKLDQLLEWDENTDARFTLHEPLAHALKMAIAARFTKLQL